MDSTQFLLNLAIILFATKALGLVSKKVNLPEVVGALLAGLLLGPALLGDHAILTETAFIEKISEIGVIVLMFCAGLDTNIDQMKKSGKASFIIALCGVIVPIILGAVVTYIFFATGLLDATEVSANSILQSIFIGVILSATSVSITVATLKELGKLSSKTGSTVLAAAIIDDVLGIIALTLVTSLAGSGGLLNILMVLGKILLFFVFCGVVAWIVVKVFYPWVNDSEEAKHRYTIMSFVICLLMAYCSEKFFGVADITGAYAAGLIISNCSKSDYIAKKFEVMSYAFLSPVFFASIGLKVELPSMSVGVILFAVVLIVTAVLSKIIGCGYLGGALTGFKGKERLQLGVGMACRGEVALIVASKGADIGIMSNTLFGPIVILIIVTAILTPVLLKIVFKDSEKDAQMQKVQA